MAGSVNPGRIVIRLSRNQRTSFQPEPTGKIICLWQTARECLNQSANQGRPTGQGAIARMFLNP